MKKQHKEHDDFLDPVDCGLGFALGGVAAQLHLPTLLALQATATDEVGSYVLGQLLTIFHNAGIFI